MVKLKNPLMSFMSRGKLGNITLLRRRKTNVAEKTPVVPDQKTPAQLSWRTMYQKAVELWHLLSAAEKREWESAATPRHMTGFAWFMSQALRPNPGIYLPLAGGTMQGDIDMAEHVLALLPHPIDVQEPLRLQEYNDDIAPYLYHEGARVYDTTNPVIPTATDTAFLFNSERYDTDGIHSTLAFTSRLTCKTAGKYVITGSIGFEANAVGARGIFIRFNGTTWIAIQRQNAIAGMISLLAIATIYNLAVNDFLELYCYQNSGGDLIAGSWGNYSPEFAMQRIG